MDLVAPGSIIVTPRLGGGATNGGHGTSYASPHAAGVAALVFSADPSVHARDIERVLQRTGDVVIHPERGDEVMRVNALNAVLSVLPATPTPSRTPTGQVSDTPEPETATPTATASATGDATQPSPTPTATRSAVDTPTGGDQTIFLPLTRLDRRR
jgi:subtilisin family serine protease